MRLVVSPNALPLASKGSDESSMSIWLNSDSRILVQGMTGSEGTKHTRRMVASGAQVVAGVTPGKGGGDVDGIPVFDDVATAMAQIFFANLLHSNLFEHAFSLHYAHLLF